MTPPESSACRQHQEKTFEKIEETAKTDNGANQVHVTHQPVFKFHSLKESLQTHFKVVVMVLIVVKQQWKIENHWRIVRIYDNDK